LIFLYSILLAITKKRKVDSLLLSKRGRKPFIVSFYYYYFFFIINSHIILKVFDFIIDTH
jgi:hypothetical protein